MARDTSSYRQVPEIPENQINGFRLRIPKLDTLRYQHLYIPESSHLDYPESHIRYRLLWKRNHQMHLSGLCNAGTRTRHTFLHLNQSNIARMRHRSQMVHQILYTQ